MWSLQLGLDLGSDKEVGESEGFKETGKECWISHIVSGTAMINLWGLAP